MKKAERNSYTVIPFISSTTQKKIISGVRSQDTAVFEERKGEGSSEVLVMILR